MKDKKEDTTDFLGLGKEKETFVKIAGQKFAYKAINIVRDSGWIEFDRINTKTGEQAGHMQFPMTAVEGIETR